MKKHLLTVLAFLATLAVLGFVVGHVLYRPDRLWALGFYASLLELQSMAALLGLAFFLAVAARLARPAARPLSMGAVVCLLAMALPAASALRRPTAVALELAMRPRQLADTRNLPNPDGPFVIYLVGDTGHEPQNGLKVGSAIAARAGTRTDPVAGTWLLGDLIEDRGGMGYQRAKLECLQKPMQPLIDLGIPLYGVIGNHDYEENAALQMISDPLLNMGGMNHYSRVFGDDIVSFFVLDSEVLRRQPEQIIWLRAAAAADKSRWRVLLLHHPLVASDLFHRGSEFCLGATADTINGVPGIDAVITGHNHFYERRKPIGNTTHITVGSGSRKAKRKVPDDAGRAAAVVGTNVFLEMTADESELEFRAFDREGTEVDSFRIHRDPVGERSKLAPRVAYRTSAPLRSAVPNEG